MALMCVFSEKHKVQVVRKGKRRKIRFRSIRAGDQCISDMTGDVVVASCNARWGDRKTYRGMYFLDQQGERRYPEEFGAPFCSFS